MITIEQINKKLGFNVDDYHIETRDTEYDPVDIFINNPFMALTQEEEDFLIDYRLKRNEEKNNATIRFPSKKIK